MRDLFPMDKQYYHIVEKYVTPDQFNEVFNGFSKYQDIYKQFIPYDICDRIETIQDISFKEKSVHGIQLILITSLIELLTKRYEHVPFNEWYNQNKEKYVNKKCIRAWNEYNELYGFTKNFKRFFIDLDRDIKLNYLGVIKKYDAKLNSEKNLCYKEDECPPNEYDCHCSSNCPAYKDEKKLNEGIKLFADHLYKLRSLFVHEAKLIYFAHKPEFFPREYESGPESLSLKPMTMYYLREKGVQNLYLSELEIHDLYGLVMSNLVYVMKKYLDEVD